MLLLENNNYASGRLLSLANTVSLVPKLIAMSP